MALSLPHNPGALAALEPAEALRYEQGGDRELPNLGARRMWKASAERGV